MNYTIYKWNDIEEKYQGAILLGNGASIKFSQNFNYKSLKKHADQAQLIGQIGQRIFGHFNTDDYEKVLHMIYVAEQINAIVGVQENHTRQVYNEIKGSLITSVRNVHPDQYSLSASLENYGQFLRNFHTVCSLNYDLILYWSILLSNRIPDGHQFKDCFHSQSKFSHDWSEWRYSYDERDRNGISLIFYPHGSLTLVQDETYGEIKLSVDHSANLLETILGYWHNNDCTPLFVAEGTSEQKMESIRRSKYLSTVYNEVIPSINGDLTIFGWSMNEQDKHILRAIAKSNISRIAVSVHQNDLYYCQYVLKQIRQYLPEGVSIEFFDSESAY
jgi:hypothetical protein